MGTRGGELKIINVDVYDVQKRRKPSKHYVSSVYLVYQLFICLLLVCHDVNEMRTC